MFIVRHQGSTLQGGRAKSLVNLVDHHIQVGVLLPCRTKGFPFRNEEDRNIT